MTFRYICTASVMHDEVARRRILSEYEDALARAGGIAVEVENLESVGDSDAIFHFVMTGGTENEVLRAISASGRPSAPVFLIAHPHHNSLPASLEILARVQQEGGRGRIFFLSSDEDLTTLDEIARFARLSSAVRSVSSSRIGLLGKSSDWLVASSQGPDVVEATWGAQLIPIDLSELRNRMTTVDQLEESSEFEFFRAAAEIREPSPADIQSAVAVYRALRQLAADFSLDALTLRCFDLVLGEKTTGCFALARLADEGVVTACEGDVPSTMALLWAKRLTGIAGWMANPARIDVERGRMLLAHCTVPRSLANRYTLRSHFESGLGVGIAGILPLGPITLVRIGGSNLDRLWTVEGEILATPREEGLCRTQVELSIPSDSLRSLLNEPLGNHLVLVPGRRSADFLDSFALF